MRITSAVTTIAALLISASPAPADEWMQFRGPNGQGVSADKNVPLKWSSTDNIAWKVDLPGPGASSPIVVGDKVYLTCYTGYGIEPAKGTDKDLRRHLLCFDRRTGRELWKKTFEPKLPEHAYQGEGSYHGYAASTPCSDGERLYVFFGKSGVYGLTLDGEELWHSSVGSGTHGWGSGSSPVLFGNLLLINASVESGSLYGLDKLTGTEMWKVGGIGSAWDTPHLVGTSEGHEVVVSTQDKLLSFSPRDGKPLWIAEGVHRYVCPSVVSHEDIVFAIGGGHTSLAVRLGGMGDVTKSHVRWRKDKGSNVGSPVYLDGHLYWAGDSNGLVHCQNAETGEFVFQERLDPRPGNIWSSAVLADGKLYFVSQHAGTFVVAAKPKFELLAHNTFADDDSRTNASPAIHDSQILLRTDKRLYCIGKGN
jgi:outer membrane protein assembly factor BamB